MTTDKQKQAIKFIKDELNIPFEGNINDFQEVSIFISLYLENAKDHYEEWTYKFYEALEGFDCDKYF